MQESSIWCPHIYNGLQCLFIHQSPYLLSSGEIWGAIFSQWLDFDWEQSWKFCSWTYWFGTQVTWFVWWEAEIGPVEKAGVVDELEMASWETLKLVVQWKQTGDQLLMKFPKMLPDPRKLCYLSHCLHSDGTSWWDFACPYLALFSGFISFLIIVVTMNIWFLHDISLPSPHLCWSHSCRVLSVLKVHLQFPPCKNS